MFDFLKKKKLFNKLIINILYDLLKKKIEIFKYYVEVMFGSS